MTAAPQACIDRLAAANKVLVVTGAGMSRESGIPTFRDPEDGLWHDFDPAEWATLHGFMRAPEKVSQWYAWRRRRCLHSQPNPAHYVLAAMDRHYRDFLLVTQNVDGLDRRAGIRRMVELHGNILRGRCLGCGTVGEYFDLPDHPLPPRCSDCHGIIRPDVVWFGEQYDYSIIARIEDYRGNVDVVIVAGTSGMVPYPVQIAREAAVSGAYAIEVNPDTASLGRYCDCFLCGPAGTVLPAIWESVAAQTAPDEPLALQKTACHNRKRTR